MLAKYQAGEVSEALRLAQRVIDLADGNAAMAMSPSDHHLQ